MKIDNYILDYILSTNKTLNQLSEMLGFFKLVDRAIFKKYIVDNKICTRKTLDKNLKKMIAYGLIDETKTKIKAKRKLIEKYENTLPRVESKKDVDIVYNTKAYLMFYTILQVNEQDIYIFQDKKFKNLYSKKIYKINNLNYIVGRVYAETQRAFRKRLSEIVSGANRFDSIVNNQRYFYIPIEYKFIFKDAILEFEEYGINFIFY